MLSLACRARSTIRGVQGFAESKVSDTLRGGVPVKCSILYATLSKKGRKKTYGCCIYSTIASNGG